ncbi:DUF2281 domain-containing protein [Chlorogloeopsis fritschii PCC 9212]|uniref:DUF2281 domain-containing protein n=1 Tax=Chlorogloeopsis fritschii PCC 6912 TaxID=211165 RepID=A0A3S1FDK6_CHLFR|nr:DUF2281 domain-containing protein [Chlorogloeopsis fritschii]RUR75998.1 hypothetical protein PCC6912_45700 [Chlorogloeopsis fritschii PCC 6912]
MTIKEILLQEIESSPESLLEETLDFLRFLKTKQESAKKDTQSPHIKPETPGSDTLNQPQEKPTDNSQLPYRPASGRSILRHAGTWAGDDFDECLQSVYATRGKAKFDYDLNPFE